MPVTFYNRIKACFSYKHIHCFKSNTYCTNLKQLIYYRKISSNIILKFIRLQNQLPISFGKA